MKAIFTTKLGSGYDDVVEERYHFPKTYLNQVRAAEGDFVIYYEPRRTQDQATGGRESYFAMARITGILPDPNREGLYYATLDSYLDFENPVPFKSGNTYFESNLRRDDGGTNKGQFGRAVRILTDDEFGAILATGFGMFPTAELGENLDGFRDDPEDAVRRLVEVSETRLFRDRVFAKRIQSAYDRTCAVTGLRIINGGGRPEAQAAHIKPVAEHGSDSVRNGLALSATFHWMFDRFLISVDEDYRILIGPTVPDQIRGLVRPSQKLLLPSDVGSRPHPYYLRYHRERFERYAAAQ